MNRFYNNGPYLAKVSGNQDPDKLGRVKVKLQVMDKQMETDWVPILNLYNGAFILPEVNDPVVIAFMGDDPDRGIILGGIWSDKQKPPATKENSGSDFNKDGKNNLRFVKSRSGHMIIFDDTKGKEKLQIIASGGKTRIEFLAKDKKLKIQTDKDLIISAKGKLGIDAKEGQVKFSKGLKLQADELLYESKGKDVKLKASQNISLEGSTIKLN